jgi:hypothetical protein
LAGNYFFHVRNFCALPENKKALDKI